MKVKLIVNPYANRWGAQKRLPAVRRLLDAAEIDYEVVMTAGPGSGTLLAAEAARAGFDGVIAAGGDGTIHEIVNGLIQVSGDGPTVPLGILPIGTGNDFSDMAGLPRDWEAAAAVWAAGHTRAVDAARVNDHYFNNNCAVAMEPLVTIENNKITRITGTLRYVVALARALTKLKAWQMKITWDDGGYEGPVYLLSVCNSPRTGGLFYMAPQAKLDDGLLDWVLAPEVSKMTVMAILPRLFKGTHLQHPAVSFGQTRRLRVESVPGTPVHADGEVLSEGDAVVEYEVLPGKLTLLAPAATDK